MRENNTQWHWMVLLCVGIGLFCVRLGNTHLWDQDEGYYATVAAEMAARNDWIKPTFNGELFGHKPPMMFWGMMLGYKIFGITELGARFASSLFGIGTILLTYQLARRLFDPLTGLMAGLAIGSCIMFTMVSRSATADAHLTFFVILSLSIWTHGYLASPGQTRDEKLLEMSWSTWLTTYGVMGLAVLTKGPIGFLFPTAIIGLFLLTEQKTVVQPGLSLPVRVYCSLKPYLPGSFLATVWKMRPLTAVLALISIAGPWYGLVQIRTDGAFLREFIGIHHMGRFAGAMDNHGGPFYYYVVACLIGLYPWSAFAVPTAILVLRDCWSPMNSRSTRFVVCWVAVYVVIFSLASTKLPNYVIPSYPALAILAGRYFATWIGGLERVNTYWLKLGWTLLALVGLMILISLPALGIVTIQGQTLLGRMGIEALFHDRIMQLGFVGVPLAFFGFVGLILTWKNRPTSAAIAFSVGAVGLISMLSQWAAPEIDQWQGAQRTAQSMRSELPSSGFDAKEASVVVLGQFRPSLVFYFGQRVDFSASNEDAIAATHRNPATMLITTDDHLLKIESQLPAQTRILKRIASLPGQDELVVLGPESLLR